MERNFGVKDFVLIAVLLIVIAMIGLAMLQFDRQWQDVQAIKSRLEQQATDLQSIKGQLDRGVAMRAGGSSATAPSAELPEAFKRIQEARDKPNFAQGDWLIDSQLGKYSSLTPMIGGDAGASEIIANVQESLCSRDPVTLEWQGLLAEKWTIQDNTAAWEAYAAKRRLVPLTDAEILAEADCPPDTSADARKAYLERRKTEGRTDEQIGTEADCPPAAVYTFKLRPNITFSDGQRLTSDDVVFTYDCIMNPAVNAPRDRAYLSQMRPIKKIDELNFAIEFRVPYFQGFELAAAFQVFPKHYYEKIKPEDYNQSTGLLMGSGPYMLPDPNVPWKPGQQVELVRNNRYWGVQPGFDRLVYREFTNQVAQETAFRNGEIDQLGCPPIRYVQLIKDEKVLERTHHFEYQSATGGYRYIAWNQQRFGKPTMFSPKGVRQAMSLLTDSKRILNEITLGYGVLATGPFNPVSKQNDPSLKPWSFDPDRAGKLLAEAGWTEKGGVLTNADGQPFTFKLTYPSGNPSTDKMVLLLKDLYARAKIRMEPDPQEWSVFKSRLENREFDAITLGWTAGIETDLFQMFHSSQIAGNGDNFMSYRSPELDKNIVAARRSLNEPERMKLWQKCHQIIYEDQPYTFLTFPKALVFMDNRLENVQALKTGLNSSSEWFVPKAQQRWTK